MNLVQNILDFFSHANDEMRPRTRTTPSQQDAEEQMGIQNQNRNDQMYV